MASDQADRGAVLRLDQDGMRLLVALERGHDVGLHDVPELRWRVSPRMVVAVRPWDDHTVVLVDADPFTFVGSPIVGPVRPLDDWLPEPELVRLSAGIQLIRNGLAVRRGYALAITDAGRLIAATRVGGMPEVHEDPRLARSSVRGTTPSFRVEDEPIPVAILADVPARQEIAVSALEDAGGRMAAITITAGTRRTVARIDAGGALLLRSVTNRSTGSEGTRFDLTPFVRVVPLGGKGSIDLDVLQDLERAEGFDRAIVRLRPPATEALLEAISAALSSGVTTVVGDVAVAYASLDAVQPLSDQ